MVVLNEALDLGSDLCAIPPHDQGLADCPATLSKMVSMDGGTTFPLTPNVAMNEVGDGLS